MLPVRRLNVRDRNGGEGPRRFIAEAFGTGLLVVAVIGSGIMAERLGAHRWQPRS